jgi:hypothetical protein
VRNRAVRTPLLMNTGASHFQTWDTMQKQQNLQFAAKRWLLVNPHMELYARLGR